MAIFKYCYLLFFSHTISLYMTSESIVLEEAEKEKLEGPAAGAAAKATTRSRCPRNPTSGSTESSKKSQVVQRQNTRRVLCRVLDFRSLWRLAVCPTLNGTPTHRSHNSIRDAVRVQHERCQWIPVFLGKSPRPSHCCPHHGGGMPRAN